MIRFSDDRMSGEGSNNGAATGSCLPNDEPARDERLQLPGHQAMPGGSPLPIQPLPHASPWTCGLT